MVTRRDRAIFRKGYGFFSSRASNSMNQPTYKHSGTTSQRNRLYVRSLPRYTALSHITFHLTVYPSVSCQPASEAVFRSQSGPPHCLAKRRTDREACMCAWGVFTTHAAIAISGLSRCETGLTRTLAIGRRHFRLDRLKTGETGVIQGRAGTMRSCGSCPGRTSQDTEDEQEMKRKIDYLSVEGV